MIDEPPRRFERVVLSETGGMRSAWEATARDFIAWAREPDHDSYLGRRRYRDTVERDGFVVRFESEHRPIGWYFDALTAAGFLAERVREIAVPDSAVSAPHHRRWQRLPLFLHIRALRP